MRIFHPLRIVLKIQSTEQVCGLCSTQHALHINIDADLMPFRRVWSDKAKKRCRSRFRLICAAQFCAIFLLAIFLVGCGERSQQLEERVTELEKDLNRTQDELRSTKQALDASNAEVSRLKAAANTASVSVPPSAHVAEAKPSAPVAENQSTPAQRPVTSSLPANRSVIIQWPGSSGASGSPNQPANQNAPASARSNAAVNGPVIVPQRSGATGAGGVNDRTVVIQWPNSNAAGPSPNQPANQNAPAPAQSNAAANGPVIVPQRSGATGVAGANNRTVVIQWPNNNAAAPSVNQPSAPSAAANPPARPVQQPAQNSTGRSDRTVIIQWPGSGQSPSP